MINYLIVGKNGFIAKKLLERDTKKYLCTSSQNEAGNIFLDLHQPEIFDYTLINKNTKVVLLAAISSPDECTKNYENSYSINVVGTKKFIEEVIKREGKVLFFSSDVVYGNTIEAVDEETMTNPFGSYAKMKDEVEKAFDHELNFKVFRLSYVLSKEDKYLSYLQNCISNNEAAEVFHPFNRKVVFINDLLEAIENILKKWDEFGNKKFNICGDEDISRKDIADFYNEATGSKLTYTIIEPNQIFWDARPKDINIHSLYLEKLLGRKPTKIKDAINIIIKGDK